MTNLLIQETKQGTVFVAKVTPGSSRTAVCGLLGGMIKFKVSAAAERGKANKCLLKFLSKQLGVRKNVIRVISGETQSIKHVQVLGISAETLLKKLDLQDIDE